MRPIALAILVVAGCSSATATPPPTDDDTTGVVGTSAPEWIVSRWFNSPPLTVAGLRGKVVFVRWFMSPDCPFCSATAPALRALHDRYGDRGLVVVGMYHHKANTPLDPDAVAGWVNHYGYQFPVAIDAEWKSLERWWTGGRRRSYTSVSFLVDKTGTIRRVHRGGTIEPEGDEFRAIAAHVEQLLAR